MLRKSTIHIIPFLLVFAVAIRNTIPDGYIVAGGDFIQWFNFPRQLLSYSYIWANESLGYPHNSYPYMLYYQFFAPLVELFGAQGSGQSILYYVVFLFGSYTSFYLSISCNEKQFRNISKTWRVALSIGYAFNIFTFYNFIGLWGFSPFLFLYVLLPLIFGLTLRYFSDSNLNTRDLALIGLVFFLTNIPNGNFPFVVSLHLVLLIFVSSTIYAFDLHTNRIKRLALYYLVIAAVTCWSVIPQLFVLLNKGNRTASRNTAISLSEWVLGQAAKFPDPFLIVNDHQFFLQFPLLLLSSIALFITAILSLLFLSNLRSRKNIKKFAWLMFFLYLVTIFLLNKGKGFSPDFVIIALFANIIMGALRSFHKTIIFIPFLLYFIVLIGMANNEKYLKYLKFFATIAITIPLVYFLRGGILVNYSYNYSPGQNYKTSAFAPIIKIPVEYASVGSLLNKDRSTHRILSAPYYLADEKFGWAFIPKWKYMGTSDPVWQMFDAPMVQMNDLSLFNEWNYGKVWDQDSRLNFAWIVRLAGLINVKYILFHADIDRNFSINAEKKFDYLEKMGLLTLEIVNEQCKIYKINEKFYYPRIYL